jgi:hypothetical protein
MKLKLKTLERSLLIWEYYFRYYKKRNQKKWKEKRNWHRGKEGKLLHVLKRHKEAIFAHLWFISFDQIALVLRWKLFKETSYEAKKPSCWTIISRLTYQNCLWKKHRIYETIILIYPKKKLCLLKQSFLLEHWIFFCDEGYWYVLSTITNTLQSSAWKKIQKVMKHFRNILSEEL